MLREHRDFCDHLKEKGFRSVNDDLGSFRKVFIRNRIVIKVPRDNDGVIDNIMEAKAWKKYRSEPTDLGFYLAPCRLLRNQSLMMAKVEISEIEECDDPMMDLCSQADRLLVPLWVDDLDTNQAGIYKGRWVAYDYALDLTERIIWEEEMGLHSEYFHEEWFANRPYLDIRKKES